MEQRVVGQEDDVVDSARQLMVVVEVGEAVEMQAHRCLQGLVCYAQSVEVGLREVETEGQLAERMTGLGLFGQHSIHVGLGRENGALGHHLSMCLAVLELRIEGGIAEVVDIIGQLLHLRLRL